MIARTIAKSFLVALIVGALVGVAYARNDLLHLPIKKAMESADAKAKLSADIKYFFGAQKTPKVTQNFGTFTANKKTNFANKSDEEGCERAFLSAMLTLQDRARREGANAVINIHSYYQKNTFKSETEYECAAGNIVGGVALRGDFVKL